MIMISSACMPLADRIRDIDLELHICEDEARRKDLTAERKIRSELLADLLAAACPAPRKNGNGSKRSK